MKTGQEVVLVKLTVSMEAEIVKLILLEKLKIPKEDIQIIDVE